MKTSPHVIKRERSRIATEFSATQESGRNDGDIIISSINNYYHRLLMELARTILMLYAGFSVYMYAIYLSTFVAAGNGFDKIYRYFLAAMLAEFLWAFCNCKPVGNAIVNRTAELQNCEFPSRQAQVPFDLCHISLSQTLLLNA